MALDLEWTTLFLATLAGLPSALPFITFPFVPAGTPSPYRSFSRAKDA